MSNATSSLRASACLLSCVMAALVGCGAPEAPRVVLAESCRTLGGSQPVTLSIASPASGLLRVGIEQRGISVLATLQGEHASSAISPIARFGVISFARPLNEARTLTLHVESRDSPEVTGDVCLSAELVPADERRQRAELAFDAAGAAMKANHAARAFRHYLEAARAFQGVDRKRAAEARHAMAEIAYENLRRDRDAFVLATWALADAGHSARPGMHAALVTLQARTFLESQHLPPLVRRAHVFEKLRLAESLLAQTPFGSRELPRFEILRGFMEYRTGNSHQAVQHFTNAAQACEVLKDWECAARARQNIASLAEEARNYTVALQAYQDALQVLPPDVNRKLTADIWGNYGRLQGTAGLFRQSERSHRISMRLHAELANCDGTRMSIARLGTLLVQVGSIGDGHAYLARAASLECPALIASARREATAGMSRDASAEPIESLPPSRGARVVEQDGAPCTGLPAPETLSEQGKLAVFHALLGMRDAFELESNPAEAERCLHAARDYASTDRTRLRLANAEGAFFLERGEPAQAIASFERGLALADGAKLAASHEHRSLSYLGLARSALLAGEPEIARQHARRSLALGSARADVGQVVEALELMARSFDDAHENETAIAILQTAAGLIEQVPIDELNAEQRATWLATQHAVFSELTTRFAIRAGEDEARAWDAFGISERGRARSIRYALNQATDVRATQSTEPASVRYQELMRQITSLASHPDSGGPADISLDALGTLARSGRESHVAPDPQQLRQRLRALDATIVEYATGRGNMFAFVIDSEHIRVVPLGSTDAIAEAAAMLYDRLRNPESARPDVQRAARRVAELVLWPLVSHIRTPRIAFVPDDALHTVPFALLPWDSGADAVPLVQRAELSVIPTTLFVTRDNSRRPSRRARFELIGDPVFRTSDWRAECLAQRASARAANVSGKPLMRGWQASLPRLPGSRKEIAAIADLARRSPYSPDVRERLGCAATPTALREAVASHPVLLHIATHGHVDAYRPRLSALALTPESDESAGPATFGLLDILNMTLDARLVVLSACDTSRGRLLPGEGVLGPAQAFLQAGAASVIASYWRIPDEATAPFMQTFYRYLLVDGLTAAAALRRAQLDHARMDASHAWAAFTLYGAPDTSL